VGRAAPEVRLAAIVACPLTEQGVVGAFRGTLPVGSLVKTWSGMEPGRNGVSIASELGRWAGPT